MNGEYLTRENYMKLHHPYNHMDIYKDVKSVLMYSSKKNWDDEVRISFVIPTYNRMELLREALESITGLDNLETYSYEIVIVDNSGDLSNKNPSLNMVMELGRKNLLYYVNERNIVGGNLNRCVELASGKYISFLHDDDLLEHQYLDVMDSIICHLEKKNIKFGGIKASRTRFGLGRNKDVYGKYEVAELETMTLTKCLFMGIGPTSLPTCGMVFSKKAFLDVGGFYEEYGVVSDYIIGYMMLKYGYRFYSLRNKVGYYRIQSNESMKLETNQCFVKGDYYFREFMYSESLPHRVFGVVFRRVQYTYSLKGLVKNAGDFGVNVKVSDMAFKGGYGRCPVRSFIFKVIRKMYYMFFAPKDMTIPLI